MTPLISEAPLHSERSGPHVHELVSELEFVKRLEVWGQYFRNSPIEVSGTDFQVMAEAVRDWRPNA